ncbi:hypothetical protein [Streptomyces sp. NBC_00096]|uniref:hypothetical protein n=1 Tax=Streptomyces sp. NBC_00096 TaxID=2975650 RepID=UPI003868CDC7
MTDSQRKPFLYVVVCAAGIADDVGKLITAAQERNWDVGVIATPHALPFLDIPAIETRTGFQIRSGWRCSPPSSPTPGMPIPPGETCRVLIEGGAFGM